jgi:hypothetical protein
MSLGCWVRQTQVPKHVWTCFNLRLKALQTKWVVCSQAAEEVVCVWGILLVEKWVNLEQWIYIIFCIKIGVSASEMLALLTWFMVNKLWRYWVFLNGLWFKEGQEDVQHGPRSGKPEMHRTDANVDTVWTLVHSDWRLGVRLRAEINMGICSGEKAQTLAWQVDSPPWQNPCTWCVKSLRVYA